MRLQDRRPGWAPDDGHAGEEDELPDPPGSAQRKGLLRAQAIGQDQLDWVGANLDGGGGVHDRLAGGGRGGDGLGRAWRPEIGLQLLSEG